MVVLRIAAEHHTFNRFDDFCPLIHSKAEFMIPFTKEIKKAAESEGWLSRRRGGYFSVGLK